MGDPTKFNYIWEYNLFDFAFLMLFISEIFIFVYTHGKKDGKEISRDRGTRWLLYLNFIVCILISFYNVSKKAAYSARTAHPFQKNGAPFRFKLSKAQQVY